MQKKIHPSAFIKNTFIKNTLSTTSRRFQLAGVVVALFLGMSALADPKTKSAMAGLFGGIRVLLPVAAKNALGEKKHQEKVEAAMQGLERSTQYLERHIQKSRGPEMQLLGQALERDVREVTRRYRAGKYEQASFLVQELTDHCITCHAHLPADADSPLSKDFISTSSLRELPLLERAHLLVATRQFDAALDAYEDLLKDKNVPMVKLSAALGDYLTLSVRIKRDLKRPLKHLKRFADRRDVWRSLKNDVKHWEKALRKHQKDIHKRPSLTRARNLIEGSNSGSSFRSDRHDLIRYLVASSSLYRLVDEKKVKGAALSESYFLLGVSESHIREDYWVAQAEAYLEAAIRSDPGGPFAQAAYSRLEEELILANTGSQGGPLPANVEVLLQELREIADKNAK
ncbi:MAG: hypothetical protein GY822_25320 [Deltaproteobacteria bacterium]|nr:hypothetical protein [Deltaproteobacteria bacterium]